MSLREEILHQERLDQMAEKFNKKVAIREVWIRDNTRIINDINIGDEMASVEAVAKKHEAIETDIHAYEERVLVRRHSDIVVDFA